uniref:Replication protein A C-terminal domain-containing protein n=1 Tax=Picea sitchensis TaxID=3332 RepID=D5A880_PICSI|nr:unknown [Picea sitchensis]
MFGMQSQSDGGSLFSGGGFMPSQATQVNEGGFSSVRKSGTATGLLPLTVKQISQATQKPSDENSNFTIDGVDVNNVTLVGMVFNKEERVTDVSFYLDDGTGRMEVKRWVNDAMESAEMADVQNGSYVRVHGHLRSFQNKKLVNAFSVRPVTDFNEVTFHSLECIFVHLYNMKVQGGATQPNSASPVAKGPPTPFSNTPSHNQFMSPGPVSVGGAKDLNRMVQSIFEEPANLAIEHGVHVDDVVRRLHGFTKKQIMESIAFLINEGYIYSTIDEDHYKSTNG